MTHLHKPHSPTVAQGHPTTIDGKETHIQTTACNRGRGEEEQGEPRIDASGAHDSGSAKTDAGDTRKCLLRETIPNNLIKTNRPKRPNTLE